MRAMVMTAPGGPEVLQLRDIPEPRLSTGREMLIRLRAAGINPVDTKLRSKGTYFPDRTPTILGCDGAGEVEVVGDAVKRFRPGDEVLFCQGGIGGPRGNYAERIVVDERFVARKPAGVDFVQAAALPLVLITAWESLHDRARVGPGQKVLIHAGAGGVGHIAIQLAKAAGAQVCTTVSSAEKAAFATSLGADRTVLYRESDFVGEVQSWTGNQGVDIALDTVGGSTFARTAEATRIYGDLVTLLQPGPDTDWKAARLRNLRISLELMLSPMYYELEAAQEHQAEILDRGIRMVDEGKLRVAVEHKLPLADAAEAHHLLERGGVQGKIVLVVH